MPASRLDSWSSLERNIGPECENGMSSLIRHALAGSRRLVEMSRPLPFDDFWVLTGAETCR